MRYKLRCKLPPDSSLSGASWDRYQNQGIHLDFHSWWPHGALPKPLDIYTMPWMCTMLYQSSWFGADTHFSSFFIQSVSPANFGPSFRLFQSFGRQTCTPGHYQIHWMCPFITHGSCTESWHRTSRVSIKVCCLYQNMFWHCFDISFPAIVWIHVKTKKKIPVTRKTIVWKEGSLIVVSRIKINHHLKSKYMFVTIPVILSCLSVCSCVTIGINIKTISNILTMSINLYILNLRFNYSHLFVGINWFK